VPVPTYTTTRRFLRDLEALTPAQREALRVAVSRFVEDLAAGTFRPGLRVKGVRGARGVFEMTWADDGRATFQYGPEVVPGEPHVVWRRVGTHDVLEGP
jgi:hypothetical protein